MALTYSTCGTVNPSADGELEYNDVKIDLFNITPASSVCRVNSTYSYSSGKYSAKKEGSGGISDTYSYINQTPNFSSICFFGDSCPIGTTDNYRTTNLSSAINSYTGNNSITNYNTGVNTQTYVGNSASWEEWDEEAMCSGTYIVDDANNPTKYLTADPDTNNVGNTLTLSMNRFRTTSNPMAVRDLTEVSCSQSTITAGVEYTKSESEPETADVTE